ncbi:hypothetical protein KT71_002445 [Congregibacter litoralis KT71]|uniref:Uncharacterized protein n=1 Tax=Congregibacter litoralis KT71 TaxID=314285 RepID=V7HV42_9GAMM|nr:hypothetical protein KT71_002445 [Congregibacter litoralis KT71]
MNVGDLVYRSVKSFTESGLIEVIQIERREVLSIGASLVSMGAHACAEFPLHTVPDPIVWTYTPGGESPPVC